MAGTRTCIAASAVLPMPPKKDAPRGGSGKIARVTFIGEKDKLRHGRGQAMPESLIEACSFLLGDKRNFSVPRTGDMASHLSDGSPRPSPVSLRYHSPTRFHHTARKAARSAVVLMPLNRDNHSTRSMRSTSLLLASRWNPKDLSFSKG